MLHKQIRITLKIDKLFLKEGFNTELNETHGKKVLLQYCVSSYNVNLEPKQMTSRP